MKKQLSLLFAFFLYFTTLSAASHQNAFVEGGSWFVICDNFYHTEEVYTIHGDTVICDKECKKMWVSSDGAPERLIANIYTEENKVYFFESDKLHLMYDFGLSVGDTTHVDMPNSSWYGNNTERYIKCVGRNTIDNNGREIEVMRVAEYFYERTKYQDPTIAIAEDDWLVGIGSIYEPFFNMGYDGIGGIRPVVLKVTVGDDVLYVRGDHDYIAEPERTETSVGSSYLIDGTKAEPDSHGFCIENHRVVIR